MTTRLTQWLADFRWAMNAMAARRFRRKVGFERRIRFDDALRPRLGQHERSDGVTYQDLIAYPDALYHITVDDVIRAMRTAAEPLTRPAFSEE